MNENKDLPLKIAYTLQNVGNVRLDETLGDAVPVINTIRGLQHAGHQVTAFQLEGMGVTARHQLDDFTKVSILPLGFTGWRGYVFMERTVRRVQQLLGLPYFGLFDSLRFYTASRQFLAGYSLCHEHNGLFGTGTARAASRLKIPYILTFSADPIFERDLVGNPLRGFHRKYAITSAMDNYRRAERILSVSATAAKYLTQSWDVPAEKIEVMPNGVDIDLFGQVYDRIAIRKSLGLGSEFVIGFVGGFQPWHGIENLIDALRVLINEDISVNLLLVGDGRARKSIVDRIAFHGLEKNVIRTGFLPQDQIPPLLAAMDVAVAPYPRFSRELWFSPLKIYEYMAAGKAIVASRDGQIAEVLTDSKTGILVDPGDPDDLVRGLRLVLESPDLRASLGENAKKQAREHHSWQAYINRLVEIYRSVIATYASKK